MREIARNRRAVSRLKLDEMSNERKDEAGGMDPREDEALWTLLGRARRTDASPYFARRVLREVTLAAENDARRGGWLERLRGVWRRPRAAVWSGAVAVAAFWLSVVLTTNTPGTGGASLPAKRAVAVQTAPAAGAEVVDTPEVASADDVEVIADLDNMISREENRLWTEDTARF